MVTASVKKVLALTAAVLALAGGGCAAGESVTVLQNGVLPTPEYSGCVDTWTRPLAGTGMRRIGTTAGGRL